MRRPGLFLSDYGFDKKKINNNNGDCKRNQQKKKGIDLSGVYAVSSKKVAFNELTFKKSSLTFMTSRVEQVHRKF